MLVFDRLQIRGPNIYGKQNWDIMDVVRTLSICDFLIFFKQPSRVVVAVDEMLTAQKME